MKILTCAREGCGREFSPTRNARNKRFCGRSCAAFVNNARRKEDPLLYAETRAASIQAAVDAWQDAVELRPEEKPRWAYDYIDHIGRVPTARYLDTLYAGRRYDD